MHSQELAKLNSSQLSVVIRQVVVKSPSRFDKSAKPTKKGNEPCGIYKYCTYNRTATGYSNTLTLPFTQVMCYAPLLIFSCTCYLPVLFYQLYIHLPLMCTTSPSIRVTRLILDLAVISILSSYSPYASYLPYLPL